MINNFAHTLRNNFSNKSLFVLLLCTDTEVFNQTTIFFICSQQELSANVGYKNIERKIVSILTYQFISYLLSLVKYNLLCAWGRRCRKVDGCKHKTFTNLTYTIYSILFVFKHKLAVLKHN